jgi:hypothetical protein
MKRSFINLMFAGVLLLAACEGKQEGKDGLPTDLVNNPATAGDSAASEDMAAFKFETTEHDFGNIKHGEKVAFSFKFTNVGKKDLVISTATGSCGCTVPQYPKMPVAPGESGVIDVTFDSNGKSGKQHKTVTVVANTIPNTTVLSITGEVIVPESNQK